MERGGGGGGGGTVAAVEWNEYPVRFALRMGCEPRAMSEREKKKQEITSAGCKLRKGEKSCLESMAALAPKGLAFSTGGRAFWHLIAATRRQKTKSSLAAASCEARWWGIFFQARNPLDALPLATQRGSLGAISLQSRVRPGGRGLP